MKAGKIRKDRSKFLVSRFEIKNKTLNHEGH
jgi:hypothetical protein